MDIQGMEKIKIALLTPYCNRPKMLEDMVKSVRGALKGKKNFYIKHFILDDGSIPPIWHGITDLSMKNYKIKLYRQEQNLGKSRYWETVTNLFSLGKDSKCEYILFASEDIVVCDNFFIKMWNIFKKLPKDSILDFDLDNRIFSKFNNFPYQQIDGSSLIPRHIMDNIDWMVLPIQKKGIYASSGVWRQVSYRILNNNPQLKIYRTNYALMYHCGTSNETSVMHPECRDINPLNTQLWIDDDDDRNSTLSIIDPWRGYDFEKRHKNSKERAILYVYGGIGNFIQASPLYLRMIQHYPRTDISLVFSRCNESPFWETIVKYFGNKVINEIGDGYTRSIKAKRSPDNKIVGDVAQFEDIIRNTLWGDRPDNLTRDVVPIDWELFRDYKYPEKCDIILCNGAYNKTAYWLRKKYQKWHEVAKILIDKGYSVASVGLPEEYIQYTRDMTHLSLMETYDFINNCKVLASNDTGLYHFANAIGKDNVVVFTATSIKKNYNPIFHRNAIVVRGEGCTHPCQNNTGEVSQRWLKCQEWACAYFEPEIIVNAIDEKLECQNTSS